MDALAWLALGGWIGCGLLAAAVRSLRRRLELAARAEHEQAGALTVLTLGVDQLRRGHPGEELAEVLDAQLDRSRAGLGQLRAATRCRGRRYTGWERSAGAKAEDLTRHTAAGFAPLAERGGRRLLLDWRAGRAQVAADRGRFAQALSNLLANAVEHGTGDVQVRGTRVGAALRIEVVDAGASGVEPGVSGPVRRTASTRRQGGLAHPSATGAPRRGLGLAIADRAVEEAGGRLELRRGKDRTTAAFELPLDGA